MLNFTNLKVLVIGDICLDVIEEGESTRISPEAPVPIILNPTKSYSLGMAGNVALNLKNLGADVTVESRISLDKYGNKIISLLEKSGIKYKIDEYFENDKISNISTIVKKRIMANGHHIARIDKESNFITENFLIKLEEVLSLYDTNQFDYIIISDYNKGFISKETWHIIQPHLERINKSNEFFVDTKKNNVLSFFEGYHIFPNSKELQQIMEYNNCQSPKDLVIELDTDFIVETKSEYGASIYTSKSKPYDSPAISKEVIDVTGAGDTFMAAFSLFYMRYKNYIKALKFANYCCSFVVNKKGTYPITIQEVNNFDKYL